MNSWYIFFIIALRVATGKYDAGVFRGSRGGPTLEVKADTEAAGRELPAV